ncbi:MAG: hypothetical protein E7386_07600 [Ruminococcaceae bacterium]|nr:hypothetical protein [Oscillospiraceae bacterium]
MDVLFSAGSAKETFLLSEDTTKDIALSEVIDHMGGDPDEKKFLKKIMTEIPVNPADMIFRQNILKDLIANEDLCSSLNEILDEIKTLKLFGGVRKASSEKDTSLYTLLETLRELVVYVDVVENLYSELLNSEISSEGLVALRDSLEKIIKDEKFGIAKEDIRVMHEDLSNVRAAVIGVNFTPDFNIEKVSAIEFVPHGIRSKYTIMDAALLAKVSSPSRKFRYEDPLLAAMAPKMEKHLKSHFFEVKKTLCKYTNYDSSFLTEMYEGLTFYLKSANLARRLKKNEYTISFPEIKEVSGSHFSVSGFYNIRLAFSGEKNIVKNDFAFTPDERIFILTGPNRGGKTIIEQGLGLTSVMMSLGLFVTSDKCEGLPFRNICTHFPIDENLTLNYGRLGEEAVRIKSIVKSADSNTLILFNETFSTTSASDGLYLSKGLIRVLKENGAYVIFNTHIHDLAKQIPEMNGWAGQGNVISLVMERKDDKNTFILKRAEPDSSSYARDIAEKYGITYEQMTQNND